MNKLYILVLALLVAITSSRLIYPSLMEKIAAKNNQQKQKYVSLIEAAAETLEITTNTTFPPGPKTIRPGVDAGYFSVYDYNTTSNASLYYIFYQCRNCTQNYTEVPVVVWLQGGPGGSSQLGNFVELGPNQVVEENGTLKEVPRQISWNNYYNLLVIDNPVGTGFSIADYYRNSSYAIAQDFVHWLVNFYGYYTQLVNTPLYLFGESYAGHWIPSFGQAILEYNLGNGTFKIPLKGIGCGDGWTDPINQLSENGLFAYSMGLVDDVQRQQIEYAQIDGVFAIEQEEFYSALEDFDVIMDTITTDGGNLNVYNFRDFGEYDFEELGEYLNQVGPTSYNTAPNVTWYSESDEVYANLQNHDFMSSTAANYSFCMQYIPVILYNGQDDIIVNSPSSQNWIGKLWGDDESFYNAPLQVWLLPNGTNGGLAKQAGNFTFVIVNKAGHLAPYDQINSTVDMVNRWITNYTNWTNPNWSSTLM